MIPVTIVAEFTEEEKLFEAKGQRYRLATKKLSKDLHILKPSFINDPEVKTADKLLEKAFFEGDLESFREVLAKWWKAHYPKDHSNTSPARKIQYKLEGKIPWENN